MKKAKLINLALLAKLGWRVITCEEEVWCRVLRAKYGVKEEERPQSKEK